MSLFRFSQKKRRLKIFDDAAVNKNVTMIEARGSAPASFVRNDEHRVVSKIGLEIESTFSPGTIQARQVRKNLKSLFNIEINEYSDIVHSIRTELLPLSSPLVYEVDIEDHVGIEVMTCPATLLAHQAMRSSYETILELLKLCGFTDKLGRDGIHLNCDKSLFGESNEEVKETMDKFLTFCYQNIDFIVNKSLRKHYYQVNADISYWLGDTLHIQKESVRLGTFLDNKDSFLECLVNGNPVCVFNICTGKHEREVIEFKWFGSTLDIQELMGIIEFMFALISFCQLTEDHKSLTLEKFCEYVVDNSLFYIDLYHVLKRDTYCSMYMKKVR